MKSLSATDTDGDFAVLVASLGFIEDSSDGDVVCANVTVFSDDSVECDEEFTVELGLVTSKDNLNLGNNSTVITLTDSDGMVNCALW